MIALPLARPFTGIGMPVAVVDIGIVRVAVDQHFVPMRVPMRLCSVPFEGMTVSVMLVMPVRVRMLERLVDVLVLMPFAHVKPHAQRHERHG